MALPAVLAGVSAGIGAIGSLFGSGSKQEIPPELREVYNLLMQQYRQGLSDKTVAELTGRAKTQIGNEAGALGALTQSRLTRAGAGTGVQQAALNRINTGRLRGIGEAVTQINLADEEAKMRALEGLRQLAPMFGDLNFTSQYGQGFQQLFGAGLNYLLNRPEQNKQKQNQSSGVLDVYDTPYNDPYSRIG